MNLLDDLIQRIQNALDPATVRTQLESADAGALAAAIRARSEPWWFHLDAGLTVFATAAEPGTGSAPHDHGLPAIIRCLDGVEGTRRYILDSEGALVEASISRLTSGESTLLDADTIHAVFNCWDHPNLVLHVYLGDFTTSTKHVWDPVTGTQTPLVDTAPLAAISR